MAIEPMISFVVPCYGYGRYLRDCLDRIFAQAGGYEIEVIAIVKRIYVWSVMTEEGDALGHFVEFVKIQAHHEDAVSKLMLPGLDSLVVNAAVVEARVHDQMGSPRIARAHSSAEAKPSSWNPYLNQAPA